MKKLIAVLVVLYILAMVLPVPLAYAGVASFATSTIGGADAVKLFIGNITGFSVVGEVIPIIVKSKENAPPDLEPYAIFAQNASPWAQPMYVQFHRIDYTSDIPISAKYCAKLVIKPSWATVPDQYALTIDTTEKSENYPNSQILLQNGDALASVYGLLKKIPTGGSYNFDRPTHVIAAVSPADCGMVNTGVSGKPVTIGVRDVASFPGTEIRSPGVPETVYGPLEWIESLQKWIQTILTEIVPMRIDITAKHTDSHVTNGWCFFGRCDPDATDEERTGKLAEVNGSLAGGLLPLKESKTPIDFNAIVNQTIQLVGLDLPGSKKTSVDLEMPYKNANSGMEDTKKGACMFSPLSEQSKLKIGHAADFVAFDDKCKPKPPATCPIDVIDKNPAPSTENSCKICGMSGAKQYMSPSQAASFGSGLSPLAVKVLLTAAETYHVPASVLLATMLHEGAFNHTDWTWSTDAKIKEYSNCAIKGPMPNCQKYAAEAGGSTAPFGFVSDWDAYMQTGTPYEGKDKSIKVKDPDLLKASQDTKATLSPCNFTDAAFMAAREIYEDSSHKFEEVPASCESTDYGTINFYQGNNLPGSCSAWTPEMVATTRLQYAEGIAEGACQNDTQSHRDYTNDIGRMVAMFDSLTCGK